MKRIGLFLYAMFICIVCHADTINLHWLNEDGSTYQNSTCVINSDLILPATPPTKYGYTFTGWKMSNYILIEYLESTGTQRIDTGIKQSDYRNNLIIKAVFKTNNTSSASVLFGVSDSNSFFCFYNAGTSFYMQSGAGGTEYKTQNVDTNIHSMFLNSAQGIIKIDQNSYNYFPNNANAPYNISIFARNEQDSYIYFSSINIYSISFSTAENVLIRDFIPVLDKNGVPCMYDRVESKFYYNAGTGQFIAGPVLQ